MNEEYIQLEDGRELCYIDICEHNPTVLIFIHGWQTSKYTVKPYEKLAQKLDVRLISFDRPGIGGSTQHPDGDIKTLSGDLDQLVEHLKIKKFSLMADSGGCKYLFGVISNLRNKPQSIGVIQGVGDMSVKKVRHAYTSPIGRIFWYLADRSSLFRNFLRVEYLTVRFGFIFRAILNSPFISLLGNRDAIAENGEFYLRNQRAAFKHGPQRMIDELKFIASRWEFDLQDIKQEVHIYHGTNDLAVPVEAARWLNSELTNSTLYEYPDDGHFTLKGRIKEILTHFVNTVT